MVVKPLESSPERGGALLGVAAYAPPLALVAVAFVSPRTFDRWMQEDAWVEWATFLAFAFASVFFVLAARGVSLDKKRDERLAQVLLLGAAAFCVFVAGEEISWGQRVFGFTPPELFLEKNFQQELNVHNLLTNKEVMGLSMDSRYLVALVALIYGVLGPILAFFSSWIRAAAPPLWLSPLLVAIAVVEIVYPIPLTGEAAEFCLGIAFLTALDLRPKLGRATAVLLSLALAPMVVLLLSWVHSGDRARFERAQAELVQLGNSLTQPGVLDDKIRRRSSVHKRIYTAQEAGYFKWPRREFFMDPWGSPYWLHAKRGRSTLWLYSFGANRRRDLDPDDAEPDVGDDVLVQVPLVSER